MKLSWRLEGYDTFSNETYPIHGEFPDKESALLIADAKFKEIEALQPASSSGGQGEDGIQDRIFLVAPDGSKERIFPGCSG